MNKKQLWFFFILTVSLVAVISGCAPKGPSGKWQQSHDVKLSFESGTILQDHTYYYDGSMAMPDAVIAIDNRYTLQTRVWAKVDIDPKQMGTWLSWYRTEISYACPFRGGLIITPDQQVAGIWYSKRLINTIRSPEPGVIEVYLPYSPPGSLCAREEFLDDL